MSADHLDNPELGWLEYPVIERTYATVCYSISERDLDRAGVETLEEFLSGVRKGEIDPQDLSLVSWDSSDSEVIEEVPSEADLYRKGKPGDPMHKHPVEIDDE